MQKWHFLVKKWYFQRKNSNFSEKCRFWEKKSLRRRFFFCRKLTKIAKIGCSGCLCFFRPITMVWSCFFLKKFGVDPAFGAKKSKIFHFSPVLVEKRAKKKKKFGRLRRPISPPPPPIYSCFFVKNFRFRHAFFGDLDEIFLLLVNFLQKKTDALADFYATTLPGANSGNM